MAKLSPDLAQVSQGADVALDLLRVDLQSPEQPVIPHAMRVESACGDFYIACGCGWISLPYASNFEAVAFMVYGCAIGDAERERRTNRAKLRQRLADADKG